MAHCEQRLFVEIVKAKFPNSFKDVNVLDVGSLDINGDNRCYFKNCNYLGVDVAEGKNVDLVCPAHQLELANESFDTIISTECFEHDMYLKHTLANILRMLKRGGLFIFTAAGPARAEHGTRRTDTFSSPLTTQIEQWKDYYKNVTKEMVMEYLKPEINFSVFVCQYIRLDHDINFWGIKA